MWLIGDAVVEGCIAASMVVNRFAERCWNDIDAGETGLLGEKLV